MELKLAHYPLAMPAGHTVTVDGAMRYAATSRPLAWGLHLEVKEIGGPRRATVTQPFLAIKPRCSVICATGAAWMFSTVSWWQGHYRYASASRTYTVHCHVGNQTSIHRGGRQVALAAKRALEVGGARDYTLQADHDADPWELACLMVCLTSTALRAGGMNGPVGWNFGRLGPEASHVDTDWTPTRPDPSG